MFGLMNVSSDTMQPLCPDAHAADGKASIVTISPESVLADGQNSRLEFAALLAQI